MRAISAHLGKWFSLLGDLSEPVSRCSRYWQNASAQPLRVLAASASRPSIRSAMGFYPLDACVTFDVPVTGLIHVGANNAGEYTSYRARTHGPVLYIEAIPEIADQVRPRLDPDRPHFIHQAVVSDVAGETVSFHVASNAGQSSSMLAPGRHAEIHPWITFDETLELVTERLDDIVAERSEGAEYNVLVLDVQVLS